MNHTQKQKISFFIGLLILGVLLLLVVPFVRHLYMESEISVQANTDSMSPGKSYNGILSVDCSARDLVVWCKDYTIQKIPLQHGVYTQNFVHSLLSIDDGKVMQCYTHAGEELFGGQGTIDERGMIEWDTVETAGVFNTHFHPGYDALLGLYKQDRLVQVVGAYTSPDGVSVERIYPLNRDNVASPENIQKCIDSIG